MKRSLIGETAYIKKNADSWYAGDWGIINAEEGDWYSVAIFGANSCCSLFNRKEFTIKRKAN